MARNPLRDGWRVLMRAPESILAEIAWRWAFSVAFWGLLFLSFHRYFSQIEISRAEFALLKSFEPFTSQAIAIRLLQAFIAGIRAMGPILFPALSLLWLLMATVGRGVTVRGLAKGPSQTNWGSLFGLNVLRLLMTFAAIVAYFGAAIIVSHFFDPREYYVLKIVILLLVMLFLLLIWGIANWYSSVAQIFAAQSANGVLDSLRNVADLYQAHSGAFVSSGIWFSFARLILLTLVTFGSLSPLGNVTMSGIKGLIIFIAIISLLYFAAADGLNMWRLGVYISLTEPDAIESVPEQAGGSTPPVLPSEVAASKAPQREDADSPLAEGLEANS